MLDTQGPEITLAYMRDNKQVEITAGQTLKIVTDIAIEGDSTRVACTFKQLPQTVRVGGMVYIGTGLCCEITETHDDHIIVVCKNDFMISDKMKINLPGAVVGIETVTETD